MAHSEEERQRALHRARPYQFASAGAFAFACVLLLMAALSEGGRKPATVGALMTMSLAMGLFVVQGVQAGVVPGRFRKVFAHESPKLFRILMWAYAGISAAYLGFALWLALVFF